MPDDISENEIELFQRKYGENAEEKIEEYIQKNRIKILKRKDKISKKINYLENVALKE